MDHCNVLKEYEHHLKTRTRYAPKTILGTMCFLKRINTMAEGSLTTIKKLNTTWYEKNILLNADLSENTKRLYLLAAKSFYEYLRFKGLQSFNPVTGLPVPHNVKSDKHKPLTEDEMSKLFDYCKDLREEMILFFFYVGGLRANELVCLNVEDIDFANNIIWVRKGKGGKMRMIPFHSGKIINKWNRYIKIFSLNVGQHALCNADGDRITYRGIVGLCNRLYALTGIRMTSHDFRYSFANHLLNKNINPMILQQVMGHESMETTNIYIKANPKRTVEAFKDLDLSDNFMVDRFVKVC